MVVKYGDFDRKPCWRETQEVNSSLVQEKNPRMCHPISRREFKVAKKSVCTERVKLRDECSVNKNIGHGDGKGFQPLKLKRTVLGNGKVPKFRNINLDFQSSSKKNAEAPNKRSMPLIENSPLKRSRFLSDKPEPIEASKFILHGKAKTKHCHDSYDIYSRRVPISEDTEEVEDNIGLSRKPMKNRVADNKLVSAQKGIKLREVNDNMSSAQNPIKKDLRSLLLAGKIRKGKSTRETVRRTLQLYQCVYRKLLQDQGKAVNKSGKRPHKRPDLAAFNLLRESNLVINCDDHILGNVPGVEVGDEFQYRAELCIIGLHRPTQGGIAYMHRASKIVATSIVVSGGYKDSDYGEVLIYSGQGGNACFYGARKRPENQKLERGNLALYNSIECKTPVRVIRGMKFPVSVCQSSTSSHESSRLKPIIYTYDGLYYVEKHCKEKGSDGFYVYKFQLRRERGQTKLGSKNSKEPGKLQRWIAPESLVCLDISCRRERSPIRALNGIDGDRPGPFKYITQMRYPEFHSRTLQKGCKCIGGCNDPIKCECTQKNKGQFPYFDGCVVESKPLIYECGPNCKCPQSCKNRVSQHGLKFELEVFKTEKRGWGVRTLTSIPSGSFVCEYLGKILTNEMAEKLIGRDEYLFDIGCKYIDESVKDIVSSLIPNELPTEACEEVEEGFTIDARVYGSVARFINHSCYPNLYAQNVLIDHDDKAMPHIMFFARENIPPLQELTYHYQMAHDQVYDSNGNIKKKACHCGSSMCSGWLY
ncbi:hypothetical protein AMTRI_Chr04g182820 [Amborella trichopoda]|uniref:Histone-lysine N-methyltransferase n=1 Tax=Amborella trichopoda TaxID=13333 RepID=W1NIG5_AMBTC|nr:histone-lysine N-methyltransferase, H3 lysine-9 specific SUVH6 [Amborella trichopoda]ERM95288.1 hypothetical protein AMTR_s00008p00103090 [Amborella trichopoda]|eukprot:XP_006827872.1 histone-lysine N-methyltransferase, H3 lysine-9 specific SUVH6 [Amborella trichopoda]